MVVFDRLLCYVEQSAISSANLRTLALSILPFRQAMDAGPARETEGGYVPFLTACIWQSGQNTYNLRRHRLAIRP